MVWFWVCAAIVLLGLGFLFLLGREVWRKAGLLLREVDAAARRADEASRPGAAPGSTPAT